VSSLISLGYKSCLADPDMWYHDAIKDDRAPYHEYLTIYVDDTLCVSKHPKHTMTEISKLYRLKDNSVSKPPTYLGAKVTEYMLHGDNTKPRWEFSSYKYVTDAVQTVEIELSKVNKSLSSSISTPLSSGYRPKLDVTPQLPPEKATYFQNIIGILHWIAELWRIDIHIHVAMLSSCLKAPREGHLLEVFHVFAYLKKCNRSTMIFDDTLPMIDESLFTIADWTEFSRDAKELKPSNEPEPRGKPVNMYFFCDANYAGDKVTRRSHTGIIIFLNRTPITRYSKKQNTVETSTFGADFIALCIAVELIEALCYKLWMMGDPIDGPCSTFCNNEAAVNNSTVP